MKKAQQKKAARHIYSSGLAGCGGKAEATNAKNAGQVGDFAQSVSKSEINLISIVMHRVHHRNGLDAITYLRIVFSETGANNGLNLLSLCTRMLPLSPAGFAMSFLRPDIQAGRTAKGTH